MDKNTIFKLIGVLVVVAILISCIELALNAIANSKNKDQSTPKVVTAPPVVDQAKMKEEANAITKTNKLLDLFNKRDYEAIYEKFPDMYKKAKYPTLEKFTDYMKSIIKDDSVIRLSDLVEHPRGIYATLTIDDKKINIFFQNPSSEDETIMFDNAYRVELIDIPNYKSDEVMLAFEYEIDYLDKRGYLVTVKNLLNREVDFSYSGSYLYRTDRANVDKYYALSDEHVKIPANSEVMVEMQFGVGSGMAFAPNRLMVDFIVDGEEYHKDISIEFDNFD